LTTAKFKVLLIEDDELAADMYRLALVAAGRVVVIGRDGEEGLRLASDVHPDFIVLDLRLPKLSGLEVLSRLRGNPKTSDIPVIILSNVGDLEMLERGSKLGVLEFMIKAHTTPIQLSLRIAEHERWTRRPPVNVDP
jgi:DNA-binding response OmpR family regulator